MIDYGYNPIEIARFTGSLNAKERRQNDIESSHVIISNRQYLFKNINKLPSFDILIADEAHTTTADSTKLTGRKDHLPCHPVFYSIDGCRHIYAV